MIEAIDTKTNLTTILVYVPGRSTHSILYDVINLDRKYDDLFMDTSGFICNYVGIVADGRLSITRQFDIPIFIVESFVNHNFTLTLHSG